MDIEITTRAHSGGRGRRLDMANARVYSTVFLHAICILLPYDSQGSGRDRPFSEMGPRKESLSDTTIRRRTADHHKRGDNLSNLFPHQPKLIRHTVL
ncbi:hypothetical protein FA13DRAFT_646306 [Coprinellus micaceus]|uniref:Uncharacterized protein n=1 Tax=Coprinellus micaceus TaxID=71717 RepID=A0A4Y7T5V1_COPMI|nr:hypothetical protein FA13DRAFT_646306 [Coprinellus micaceus]